VLVRFPSGLKLPAKAFVESYCLVGTTHLVIGNRSCLGYNSPMSIWVQSGPDSLKVQDYMVQVYPMFYSPKAIITASPVQDECQQCTMYQKCSLPCITAELNSKSAISKCQICWNRGIACKWGKHIPRQMNLIKLKIHSTDNPTIYSKARDSKNNDGVNNNSNASVTWQETYFHFSPFLNFF